MSNLKAIHEAMRLQPINKLMVVGHPLSGYASVEQVLHGCGLQAAAASKTQGLSPTQVSYMLLQAYRVTPLEATQALEALSPINPSPVWQTLALDLLVGNLEQELWGWADPQAIYLLDYWKNLDHQLAFVLVYDSPQASMAGLFENPEVDCTEAVVQAASANWLAYNEALLNFYLGNTERCLLVHGQQVRAQTGDYLRQVQHQMGVELQMPWGGMGGEVKHTAWNALQTELCSRVLSANPKMAQMYADLQSVASMPQGHVKNQPSFDTDMAVLSKFVALHRSNLKIQRYVEELKAAKEAQEQALNQQLATLVQSFEKAHAYGHAMAQEKQQLVALAESRLEQMEGLTQREAKLEVRLNNLNRQLDQARIAIYETQNTSKRELEIGKLDLEEDNKLLVAELNKVQEELEQFHIQNQQLQFKITQDEEKFSPKLFGAALQVKNELPYKLGAAIVSCKGSLKASLGLPFRLRRIVNEFETQSRSKLPLESSNYSQYIDFHEAEKIKQHLSYKFGEILIQTNGSIFKWITLPLRLNTAYQTWRKFRV